MIADHVTLLPNRQVVAYAAMSAQPDRTDPSHVPGVKVLTCNLIFTTLYCLIATRCMLLISRL